MREKIIWHYIMPALLKIRVTRKWAWGIYGKKIGSIVADCIKNAESIKSDPFYEKCPTLKSIAMYGTLMPVAWIISILGLETDWYYRNYPVTTA